MMPYSCIYYSVYTYHVGKLGCVENLTNITSSNTSVSISWTAPFSLNVTNEGPDIWYTVFICEKEKLVIDKELDTAAGDIVVTHNDTVDDTMDPICANFIEILQLDTSYTLTPEHPSPCIQYVFTVIPYNGAGEGECSLSIAGYTIRK